MDIISCPIKYSSLPIFYFKDKYFLNNIRCSIVKKPYEINKKWYIMINILDNDIIDSIHKTDEAFISKFPNTFFKKSMFKNSDSNILICKIPYRYKKFEISCFDEDNHFMSCYDFLNNDLVSCDISHGCFSSNTSSHAYISSWKLSKIKKLKI